jgi:hypothetical protein
MVEYRLTEDHQTIRVEGNANRHRYCIREDSNWTGEMALDRRDCEG